jgi:hypothetical protein
MCSFILPAQCACLLMALQGRDWNVADLAFPSPTRTAGGVWTQLQMGLSSLLGLAHASWLSRLTFSKIA